MKISQIIQSVKAVGSTNTKRDIIAQHRDNVALQHLFYAAYDGSINFWIRADKSLVGTGTGLITADLIQDLLESLNGRVITGNAARDYLKATIVGLDPDEAEIIIRMINRDLDCKASTSIANAVWPGLIREFPVMLADKFNEKNARAFYAVETKQGEPSRLIVQRKEDGGRAEAVVTADGAVALHSRNGNELLTHGVFDFLSYFNGYIVDGEIISIDPVTGAVRDRKTSNGKYNKCVRNTISKDEAETLHYVVWDLIPIKDFFSGISNVPYQDRFDMLRSGVSEMISLEPKIGNYISVVESRDINTVSEATEFYGEMLAEGCEGAMLKLAAAGWEDRRSRSVLKLKEELDATLLCVGVTSHAKRPDWIGSLECRSQCGQISVSVGSGLTEEDRKKDPGEFINSLIAVKYNALIKSKNNQTHSMFLPIYQHIRSDVTDADTLEKLS